MSKNERAVSAETFDAGVFVTEEVGQMTVRHPQTGAPTTWVWEIAGPGHAATIAQSERVTRKSLREAKTIKEAQINGRKYRDDDKEPAQLRRENAEFFAERVLGWTPVTIQHFGGDVPFTRENVIKVLLDPTMPGIFAQVIDYFRADENFMKRSAPTS